MKHEQLAVGRKVWVVRRYQCDEVTDYVDGPFLVVAFDREMVYAIREHGDSGEFFPTSEVALERKAAEESLEKASAG